jgi:hypothetical protein
MKNVTLAIFALTTAICCADLFDHEAQLALRYGKPAQVTGDSRLYRWGGMYVAVQLRDIGQGYKVSVSEAFKREDSGQLTASDIEKCLPSPTTGGKWIRHSDTEWQLRKKPIVANLVEEGTMIVVRHSKLHRPRPRRVWIWRPREPTSQPYPSITGSWSLGRKYRTPETRILESV